MKSSRAYLNSLRLLMGSIIIQHVTVFQPLPHIFYILSFNIKVNHCQLLYRYAWFIYQIHMNKHITSPIIHQILIEHIDSIKTIFKWVIQIHPKCKSPEKFAHICCKKTGVTAIGQTC